MSTQQKQNEWHEQWSLARDDVQFLFEEWIFPNLLEDFRGKLVLDAGCGRGQHTGFCAPYARKVVAVDLNTSDLACRHNAHHPNVECVEGDIARFEYPEPFDVVYCVGVIHHTDDPDETFENLFRLCKPGGRLIIWCYSAQGNALVRWIVEPLRKAFLRKMRRTRLMTISRVVWASLCPLIYTIYRLPFLRFLPFYEYFANARRLSFERNVLNVFDKLNAPQTQFITRRRVEKWLSPDRFTDVHISPYKGVSWRASGTRLEG